MFHSLCREANQRFNKKVVFADGIIPGEGTSASENNTDDDEDNVSNFGKKKLSTKQKHKKRARNSSSGNSASCQDSNASMLTDKENKVCSIHS